MVKYTATEARRHWFALIKKSVKSHVPIKIASKTGSTILISEEDYQSLLETLELLSTPGIVKRVHQAKADIKAGRTRSLEKTFKR